MHLPSFIAWRYLFAKKSHNVINIISLISALGIMFGTMALIIVLSVYNGFQSIVDDIYSKYDSDIEIFSQNSKSFLIGDIKDKLESQSYIANILEVVEENIFLVYDKKEGIATIKGVTTEYQQSTPLSSYLIEGEFKLKHGEINQAVVGASLARKLSLRTRFLDPIEVYFPNRKAKVSLVNPLTSLNKGILYPSGIISLEQGFDSKYMFVPIDFTRNLFDYADNELTKLELNLKEGIDINSAQKDIIKLLSQDNLVVKTRYQINDTVYKMMKSEKIAIYVILLFIIVVISCNVFGSLTMLIIEKSGDISTLKSMGATDTLITRIFAIEGWMISILGALIGLVIGIVLCLIQQYAGIIEMPGNFVVKYYPIILQWKDILYVFIGVISIGFLITSIPAYRLRKNIF